MSREKGYNGSGNGIYPATYASITALVLPATGAAYSPDGTAIADQETVLFTGFTVTADRGIYRVTVSAGKVTAWTRVIYGQSSLGESTDGDLVVVIKGTTYADHKFQCTDTPLAIWVDLGVAAAAVLSVTDDGNSYVNVDNSDPLNPVIGFAGVNVDGVTITGSGVTGDPLVAVIPPPDEIVDILYADLVTAIGASTLLPGKHYKITDYQTIHKITDATLVLSTCSMDIDILNPSSNVHVELQGGYSSKTDVTLVADGVKTINEIISDWMTLNPGFVITLTVGDGTWIPDSGTNMQLTGSAGINVAVIEPIIVFAEAINVIGTHALSEAYPQDSIEYDYTMNLAEDGTTPRPGLIVWRKDTKNNIEAFYDWRTYKFRRWSLLKSANETYGQFIGQVTGMTTNVTIDAVTTGTMGNITLIPVVGDDITDLISAWNTAHPTNQVVLTLGDGTQIPTANITLTGGTGYTYNSGEAYPIGSVVTDSGYLYYCYKTETASTSLAQTHWLTLADLASEYLFTPSMVWGTTTPVLDISYVDYTTFDGSETQTDVYIGLGSINNIFLAGAYRVSLNDICVGNTFGDQFLDNNLSSCNNNYFDVTSSLNTLSNLNYSSISYQFTKNTIVGLQYGIFGNICTRNTIKKDNDTIVLADGCSYNLIGIECSSITIGQTSSSNTFGNTCARIVLADGCTSNIFGDSCSDNTYGSTCFANTLEYLVTGTVLGTNCENNHFDYGANDNVLTDGCTGNTFGSDSKDNLLGLASHDNHFGKGSTSNHIGDGCQTNNFGDQSGSNVLGDSCQSNKFGDYCSYNIIGDSFSWNTLGNNCQNNTFADFVQNNTIGDNARYNYFGSYFGNDVLGGVGYEAKGNIIGDSFRTNYFDTACLSNEFGNSVYGNVFGSTITIVYSSLAGGTFVVGSTLTNSTNNSTAIILTDNGSDTMTIKSINQLNGAPFNPTDALASGAVTAVVDTFTVTEKGAGAYGYLSGFNNNKLGNGCNKNWFDVGVIFNTLGDTCENNTFGQGCEKNIFGVDCDTNSFGDTCISNTLGDVCGNNTFLAGCIYNKLGDGCVSNYFGLACGLDANLMLNTGNTLGNTCRYNSFADYSVNNIIGNECTNLQFGVLTTLTYSNLAGGTFGVGLSVTDGTNNATILSDNGATSMTIFYSNNPSQFGIFSVGATLSDGTGVTATLDTITLSTTGFVQGNILDNECSNFNLKGVAIYNNIGSYVDSIIAEDGFSYNTFGNAFSYGVFGTNCTNNSFGSNCGSILFNTSSSWNKIGNSSTEIDIIGDYNEIGDNCQSIDSEGNTITYNKIGNLCGRLYLTTMKRNVISDQFLDVNFNNDAVQKIAPGVASIPDGGTYTITFDGNTTGNIAYNANPTIALAAAGLGDLKASTSLIDVFLGGSIIRFTGAYGSAPQALIVVDSTLLTKGGIALVNPPVVTTISVGKSSAVHVAGDYDCEIFSRQDGTFKLKYMDNTDNYQIVVPTA